MLFRSFVSNVPLRTAAQAKGYAVSWDEATYTVTLTKGEAAYTVDINAGEGQIINDVTYVPASFLEEL